MCQRERKVKTLGQDTTGGAPQDNSSSIEDLEALRQRLRQGRMHAFSVRDGERVILSERENTGWC